MKDCVGMENDCFVCAALRTYFFVSFAFFSFWILELGCGILSIIQLYDES